MAGGRKGAGVQLLRLGFEGVHPLAVVAAGAGELQAHLLADYAGKETSHAVRLPASGLLQFGGSGAAVALDQGQDFAATP